jgi:outer membrane protein assembly factor BamE (lipoprotein component of BamABCDE complex)
MDLLKAGVRFFAWLALSQLLLAQAPQVTDTKLVDAGKGQELLRKINGRWWSQDNREVYPPSKGGVFWELDSKPGTCQFFHHRPFQLARAESLRLWMRKDEVEAALGPPNRVFGTDNHAFWYYYASNGIKLTVRFMDDGVLGEAKYYAVGEKSWPVASIERELNGRDIYKLLQERATKRSQEWLAQKMEENRIDQAARSEALRRGARPAGSYPSSRGMQPSMITVESANVPRAAETEAPAKKRIVSTDALAAVTLGATRDDVLKRLGEPNSRFTITGDEGVREAFTYDLDSGETVVIRLVDGKVTKVR